MPWIDYTAPPFPPGYRPIVTFDTSAHNTLCDRASSDDLAMIRELRHISLAGTCVEEMFATRAPERRQALLESAKTLIDYEHSDVLVPQHEILKRMVEANQANPWKFDWRTVDVSAPGYRQELYSASLIEDHELAAEQRQQNKQQQGQFRKHLTNLRPSYEAALKADGRSHPLNFREEVLHIQSNPKRFDVSLGKVLYDGIAGTNFSREKIREFLASCDPFRAAIYGYIMGRYDLALRDQHGERFQAGQTDLYMAVYLPYCNEFVTDEKNGEQERCLRELSEVLATGTNVLSYADFIKGLLREKG